MKKIIIILLIYNLYPGTCYTQWYQQYNPMGGGSNYLEDVIFINQNTGWACGNGYIIKTTNSGINWVTLNIPVTNKLLMGIHAVDSQYIYCVGYFETILKSTDGGSSWIIIRNGNTNLYPSFLKTYFINRNTGWLLKNSYVLRTNDGGFTFDSTQLNFSYLNDIYFKDSLNGVLCCDAAGIFKSTNGGITWSQIQIPLPYYAPNFYRESFSGNYGWVVGGSNDNLGGLCWRTTNFGTTWDTISRVHYPTISNNYSVFFSSSNIGWCGQQYGTIFKTTNSGLNWYQQYVPTNGSGFRADLFFVTDSIGWVVGGGGYILHTTNGGTYAGIKPISNLIPKKFQIYNNYPNPFNFTTIIDFDISEDAYYKFEIFDVLGKKIEEVLNEFKFKGKYRISYDAFKLTSGVYFYRLSSQNIFSTKKFILIK